MSSQALSSLLKDQVHGPTTAPITVSVSIDCFVQDWQSLDIHVSLLPQWCPD